jgi:hypothetical protein
MLHLNTHGIADKRQYYGPEHYHCKVPRQSCKVHRPWNRAHILSRYEFLGTRSESLMAATFLGIGHPIITN